MQVNNQTMMVLGTCVIWSLSRSDNNIRISYSNELCSSTSSNVGFQWYEY